jgi:MFS family permease
VSKWSALTVLALAQFLMVLDQAVMNVSITQLVEDFGTNVTTIQGVITMYSLVMATLMVTGGKVGDIIGRRRAFTLGHVTYAGGSALTAASWSVPALLVGRSSRGSALRSCCPHSSHSSRATTRAVTGSWRSA